MTFKAEATVREVAQQRPLSIRLFEELGIDYCCGGSKSLAEACRQVGASLEVTLRRLSELETDVADPDFMCWHRVSLSGLIRHIVENHHGYVRKEIPRLQTLLEKVHARHGAVHHELAAMKLVFGILADEMLNHMQKEEQVLFPYIEQLEQANQNRVLPTAAPFGTVARPVECMMRDHAQTGKEILHLHALSNGFTLPKGACLSFRALYDGLCEFEQDLHRHVHLENNILFPRAIELEAEASTLA